MGSLSLPNLQVTFHNDYKLARARHKIVLETKEAASTNATSKLGPNKFVYAPVIATPARLGMGPHTVALCFYPNSVYMS